MTVEGGQTSVTWFMALVMAFLGVVGSTAQDDPAPAASPVAADSIECAAVDPSGLLVYQLFDEPGAEVVVVDPATGEELHRVQMQGASRLGATNLTGRALISDDRGRIHVLDAVAGTVMELSLSEEFNDVPLNGGPAFSRGQGSRYMLLGTNRQDQAALVDLETGETTDLMELTGEEFVLYGMISPGDDHAVVTFGEHAYLIPTANPAALRQLGSGDRSSGAFFSPDGGQIVYSQAVGEDRFELVVERPDGADSRVVYADEEPLVGQFAGSPERLLVRTSDQFLIVDVATGEARDVLNEYVTAWIIAPDESKVLVHGDDDAERESDVGDAWALIDLEDGERTELDGLDDHVPIWQGSDSRWIVMADPSNFGGEGGENDVIYGVDLLTGATTELFAAQEGESYAPPSPAIPDGRYALLYAGVDGGDSRLRLLDAAAGSARVVAEGIGVGGGAISPDGCWITVETTVGSGDARSRSIAIQPIAGGETRPIAADGHQAVWIATSS